eukprot:6335983-Alexandrium_andersonii.AAC.1
MSASLVGSEMCIRDRSDAPHIFDLMELRPYSALGTDLRNGLGMVPNAEAVSYTHLTLPTICSV